VTVEPSKKPKKPPLKAPTGFFLGTVAVTVSALRIGEVAKERNPEAKVDDGLGILEARMMVRIEVDIFFKRRMEQVVGGKRAVKTDDV